jgi:peptide/nickel transport system substrate-binding protein
LDVAALKRRARHDDTGATNTMRPRIAAVLGGVALVLAVNASCAPEATCPGDWCGTAVVVSAAEADVLLPVVSTMDIGISIGDFIYLRLADIGPDLNLVDPTTFVPQLARSWSVEDPRTIVFTVHPEARWHDGTAVTADDVAFTFDVYRDSLVGSHVAPRLTQIASVSARDEHTVAFRFRQQYAEMFFDAAYHMRILPRHLLDTVPRARFAAHPIGRNPVGSGPYRFVRWNAGQSIELAGDSTFFLGRPGVRRVIWRFSADVGTAAAQFAAGEADVVNFVPPEMLPRVAEDDNLRAIPWTPSTFYSYVQFNFRDPDNLDRPHPLFADRAVREAVAMAVNREEMVRAVFGEQGIVAKGPIAPAHYIWDEEFVQVPFDTTRARTQLAELGWRDHDGDGMLDRDGERFEFNLVFPMSSAARRRQAEILQEQLRRVGITMTLTGLDFGAYGERGRAHRFDTYFGSYGGDFSPSTIPEVWTTGAGNNHGAYSNPRFDRIVQQALDAPDMATARARWVEAVNLVNRDIPAVWTTASPANAGVHARFVQADRSRSLHELAFSASSRSGWRMPP